MTFVIITHQISVTNLIDLRFVTIDLNEGSFGTEVCLTLDMKIQMKRDPCR